MTEGPDVYYLGTTRVNFDIRTYRFPGLEMFQPDAVVEGELPRDLIRLFSMTNTFLKAISCFDIGDKK